MQKANLRLTLLFLGFLSLSMIGRAVEVTFRVDMSEQTVAPEGVHIAGSFQGWDPAATQMTLTQNEIYAVTVDLTPGEEIEYKFINGNAWGMDETIPAGCAQNGNRYLTVPNENTELEAVCFGSCTICNPPLVEITFQVDMSNETVSPDGVHIAGSFQGWDPGATEMTLIGDNIYAYTTELEAGNYYEYKYINGIEWGQDETVPPECAMGWNRFINVPFVPTTLDPVCFGSCYPCGPPPVDINVTFQVDMSEQTISPDGVHIAGGFQGWDPGATEMTDAGDNIYTYTTVLSSGTYQEYKYVNGTTWEESENVPPECGVNNNRYFTVPWNDTVMEAVCYGECGPCGPPPVEVDVTFQVDMSNETVSPDGIHLTGSFQGWDPAATAMTDVGDDVYTATVTILSGEYHEYKFVNGNTFDFVEQVPEECGVPDGQGGFNRYLTVPQNDTTLDVVCFGSCEPCLPPQPEHNVTFRVDMSNESVSADGVHLAGSFQGWDPTATEMTLTNDNIYEVTILLEQGTDQEFKFINGISFDFAEEVPEECGVPDGQGGFNRYLTVPANDTTLTAVCFSSCDPCMPPQPEHAITFRVDMTYEDVSPDGVHLAGTFQGWDPAATPMELTTGDVYEVTLMLEETTEHEFKFINGNTFDGAELVPPGCAQNGNRYFTVPANDSTMTAVCFGSCDPCGPPPVDVNVTFRVDMANEEVSADGVHIAGSFQGWDPGATSMTVVEESLYEYTTVLTSGELIEYKFINGDEWGDEEIVPEECAYNNNRFLTVPAVDTILPDVCFGSCDTCIVIGINDHGINPDRFGFYPNPATNTLYFYEKESDPEVSIFTVDGKLVTEQTIRNGVLDISALNRGLYFIRISINSDAHFDKLIVE